MAEVILKYDTQLRGKDDRVYGVQAIGRARPDGMWEGWLEFVPVGGGEAIVGQRETTQPNRADLVYWATGLTDPYLDGALLRAQSEVVVEPVAAPSVPVSDAPTRRESGGTAPASAARAVLDPFHVYAEGDEILRGQLGALSGAQLRNIVRAYSLSDLDAGALERLAEAELVTLIMAAVEREADG